MPPGGGTFDGDHELWHLRRRLVRLDGELVGACSRPRAHESFDVRTQTIARRIAMITDGTSNTMAVAEGPICHLHMAERPARRAAARPRHRDPGSPTAPLPGPNSIVALSSLMRRAANGPQPSRRPIGHTRWNNGGVYYSGSHAITHVQPCHRLPTLGRCRWTGTGSTRTTADRPSCPSDQQLPSRRGQRPFRRRERSIRQEQRQSLRLVPGSGRSPAAR